MSSQADTLHAVRELSERHCAAVVAGDNKAVVGDFLPDRWQQIVGSVKLPDRVTAAEVVEVRYNDALDCPEAIFRFRGEAGASQDVRARWTRHSDTWRISAERNVPIVLPPPVEPLGYDPIVMPHVEAMHAGKLKVQRCTSCETWIWAPRHLCPECHSLELTYETVAPEGTVYSWTRTVQAFVPEMAGHVPYVVVLAELPYAGGVRVLGVLDDPDDDRDPAIGDAVVGSFEPVEDGRRLLRWRLA